MLVVHPASTCDVCLEGYTSSENIPYSIACGHVFCLRCLHSLRQHICPLCRSPFDSADVRKIHVDRNAQSPRRSPSPQRTPESHSDLPANNALGLFDLSQASQLQSRMSELVLGVPSSKSRMRELIQDTQLFLGSEPPNAHTTLRASLLLLCRFNELQNRYIDLEDNNFELRSELNRNKQIIQEYDRKYKDLQRSRARDQESARAVEASLRERLRIEELEWQRKFDYMSEECSSLRDELDALRLSASKQRISATQIGNSRGTAPFYCLSREKSSKSFESLELGRSNRSSEKTEVYTKGDMYNFFNPDLFNISPSPSGISLSSNKTRNEVDDYKKQKLGSPKWKTSLSNNISRASDSAAALKQNSSTVPIPNRQRSDSNPNYSKDKPNFYLEGQTEFSSSAPSSYMYRTLSPTRGLFPTTPRLPALDTELGEKSRDVERERLYNLLEKPVPANPSVESSEHHTLRPPLIRCSDSQQSWSSSISSVPATPMSAFVSSTSPMSNSSFNRSQPQVQVQTSLLSASRGRSHTVSQSSIQRTSSGLEQAISPIQKTPPRPVLPHMHSFTVYTPPKPVSPQEFKVDIRGSLPRRGSLSSASAAAAADHQDRSSPSHGLPSGVSQSKRGTLVTALTTSTSVLSSAGGSPAVVPPSTLGQSKSRLIAYKGQWETQESD